MVDLLGVPDPIARAQRAAELGAAAVCWHIGIDMQMQGRTPFDVLADLTKASPIPVAVAGGLNSETVAAAVRAGAQILIVGGAITKSAQVTEATRRIREAIDTRTEVATEHFRRYSGADVRAAFLKVSSPNVTDAMQRKGAMHGILARLKSPTVRVAGPAVTVVTRDGDWAKPVEAIDRAGPATSSWSMRAAGPPRSGGSSRAGAPTVGAWRPSSSTGPHGTSTRSWSSGSLSSAGV